MRRRITAKPNTLQTTSSAAQERLAADMHVDAKDALASLEAKVFDAAFQAASAIRTQKYQQEQQADSLAFLKALQMSDELSACQLMAKGKTASLAIPEVIDPRSYPALQTIVSGEEKLDNPTPLFAVATLTSGELRIRLIRKLLFFNADSTITTKRTVCTSATGTLINYSMNLTPAEALARKDLLVTSDNSVLAAVLFLAEAEQLIIKAATDETIAAVIAKAKNAYPESIVSYFNKLATAENKKESFYGVQHRLNTSQVERLRELMASYVRPYVKHKIKLGK